MSQSVGTLRNMSSAIGNELDEQAVMLDEFGGKNVFSYLLMILSISLLWQSTTDFEKQLP